MKKMRAKKDLSLILSETSLAVDKSLLERMYKDATDGESNFFMIDINSEANKFRKGFEPYLID